MQDAGDRQAAQPLLSLRDVDVSFGSVRALASVGIDVDAGEVRAVLGENGAGKSTLMNVIYGLVPARGEIHWRGQRVYIDSPLAAKRLGIGMVHQELALIDALRVVDNLALAVEQPGILIDYERVRQEASKRARDIGLEIGNLDAIAGDLPVGVRQRIEILKALLGNLDLLILDEPTALLTPDESAGFFEVLQTLRERGVAILFITHKLREAMAIADSVTVLRAGSVVAQLPTRDTDERELAELMVGKAFTATEVSSRQPGHSSTLRTSDLTVIGDDGVPHLRSVNLELADGEIFGIAGVDGNGQRELFEVLSGLRQPSSGFVKIAGETIAPHTPRGFSAAGVRSIPPERRHQGAVLDMTVTENAVLDVDLLNEHCNGMRFDRDAARTFAESLIGRHAIACAGPEALAESLSGGNLQKLIVARALTGQPRVVVAANPTRGLDVTAAEHVHTQLIEVTKWGGTVLLLSSDLDEILLSSHRIGVLYRGRLSRPLSPPYDRSQIGMMMGGAASLTAGGQR